MSCNCPDPKLCERLKMHVKGRLWDIWNGINISPQISQQYRAMWEQRARLNTEFNSNPQPVGKPCNCGKKDKKDI